MAPFLKSILASAVISGYFIRDFEFEHAPPPKIKSKLNGVDLVQPEIY